MPVASRDCGPAVRTAVVQDPVQPASGMSNLFLLLEVMWHSLGLHETGFRRFVF